MQHGSGIEDPLGCDWARDSQQQGGRWADEGVRVNDKCDFYCK